MKPILSTIIVILLFTLNLKSQHILSLQSGHQSPLATIDEVSWIAGHWRGEAMGGVTEEIWSPPLGNAMMGSFRLIKFNKVSFYELEAISEENESLILRLKHFHGNMKGWEEKDVTVDFPLVKLEKNMAYFDGMTFEKVSKTELNVYVLVGNEENTKEMMFTYTLVQ